jgi:AmiR/NasT family two-component response regulator
MKEPQQNLPLAQMLQGFDMKDLYAALDVARRTGKLRRQFRTIRPGHSFRY